MTFTELTKELIGALPARRGNIYPAMIRKKRPDGSVRENGPYYIWTRCEDGKMKSSYVPEADVSRYKQEIESGHRLEELIKKLWKLAEGLADSKKKRRAG